MSYEANLLPKIVAKIPLAMITRSDKKELLLSLATQTDVYKRVTAAVNQEEVRRQVERGVEEFDSFRDDTEEIVFA